MGLSESHTRAKLIDPAIHARGWTEDLIKREETAGAIQIIDGKPRKQARGRVDYTLRVKVNLEAPAAVSPWRLFEAKAENLPPNHGLEQAKLYAASKRLEYPAGGHKRLQRLFWSGKSHFTVAKFEGGCASASGKPPFHQTQPYDMNVIGPDAYE